MTLANRIVALYRQAQLLEPAAYGAWLHGQLHTLLPHDWSWQCGLRIDAGRGVTLSWVDPLRVDTGMCTGFNRVRHLVPLTPSCLDRRGQASIISPLAAAAGIARLGPYRVFFASHGIEQILSWSEPGDAVDVATIQLTRSTVRFRESDLAIADEILPHALHARRINTRLFGGIAATPDGAELAVVDGNGAINHCSAGAIALLKREFSAWTPPVLPPSLDPSSRHFLGPYYAGRRIAIEYQRRAGLAILSIRPRGDETLTARQWEIASLIVDGHRYADAAAALDLSVSTIRNQLHRIYGKLGIARKSQLHAALRALRDGAPDGAALAADHAAPTIRRIRPPPTP